MAIELDRFSKATAFLSDIDKEPGVRDFIRFISVWGSYMAFSAAGFAFVIWLMFLDDDPNHEKAA